MILSFLLFPGFLFSYVMGGLGWWLERKLTARFQYRVGPPWYQNFLDIAKLFVKETLIPESAVKSIFIFSPVVGFSFALFFSTLLGRSIFFRQGFSGDVFVLLYLMVVPSLCIILGGFSSGNPLATAGSSREMKLVISAEFCFVGALLVAIIKAGSLSLGGIISFQENTGSLLRNPSGIIGFVLGIIYIQAKLGICPFDISEAEQEIMAGPFIEYSGPLLGLYRLSKSILYFSLPLFVVSLFWAGSLGWHIVYKYLIMILIISVIKNTNPRLRIGDVLRFFWFFLFPLGIVAVILAIRGF